jgi:trehalose-phosphatase
MEAKLPQKIRRIIRDILLIDSIKFVIVSGRPAIEVAKLYGMEEAPDIWGSHGWEFLPRRGAYRRWQIDARARAGMEAAQMAAEKSALLPYCEIKTGALAMHWRDRESSVKQNIRVLIATDFAKIAKNYGLFLRKFNGGVELLARGRNKGDAVKEIIDKASAATLPIYLGDDTTDEDAFRIVARAGGFGVIVGDEVNSTHARLKLETYNEVIEFLAICSMMKGGEEWQLRAG